MKRNLMDWHYSKLESMDVWDVKTEILELEKEGFSYFSCPRNGHSTVASLYDEFCIYSSDLRNNLDACNTFRFSLDSIWKDAENLKAEFGNKGILLASKAIRFYALNRFLEDEKFVKEYGLKEIEKSIGMGEEEVVRMILNGEPIPGKYIGREINLDGFSMMAL